MPTFDPTGRPARELTANSDGQLAVINILLDGGDSPIPTGVRGDFQIGYDLTIVACDVFCTNPDVGGNLVAQLYATNYSGFNPPTHPAIADKITGSTPPTLTAEQKSQDLVLAGWTVDLNAGTILRCDVISADIGAATIALTVQRRNRS